MREKAKRMKEKVKRIREAIECERIRERFDEIPAAGFMKSVRFLSSLSTRHSAGHCKCSSKPKIRSAAVLNMGRSKAAEH